jgi:prepilin peptidase CpaA
LDSIVIGWALAGCYGLACAGAAVEDASRLRISNAWFLALLAIGMVSLVAMAPTTWWQHLVSFALLLAGGMGLFAAKWIGGGDAKLLAGAGLAFNLTALGPFLLITTLAGGAIAVVSVIVRGGLVRGKRDRRLPYGVPIAAGALSCLLMFWGETAFSE